MCNCVRAIGMLNIIRCFHLKYTGPCENSSAARKQTEVRRLNAQDDLQGSYCLFPEDASMPQTLNTGKMATWSVCRPNSNGNVLSF